MTTIIATDAIAVRVFHKNSVYSGLGNELWIHTAKGSKYVTKLQNKIHGIEYGQVLSEGLHGIYGSKELMIFQYNHTDHVESLWHGNISDWISALKFLEDSRSFVLLTAHSTLLRFSIREKSWHLFAKYPCEETSTLYSAFIFGNCWNEVKLFGGNAFGEVFIWAPSTPNEPSSVQKRFKAHNGVIFSLYYDPTINLLLTTSDDRSVRFWNVQLGSHDWSVADIHLISSGFSHEARVFQARVVQCEGQTVIISIGEDSNVCVWRRDGELIGKDYQQFGAKIWQFDYDSCSATLFTVGSTGNLIALNLNHVLTPYESSKCLPVPKSEQNENISKFRFLTNSTLLGVTNRSRLAYNKIHTDEGWQFVPSVKCNQVVVMEVKYPLLALCSAKKVALYNCFDSDNVCSFEQLFEVEIMPALVRAFQFLDATNFLISDEDGNCVHIIGKLGEKSISFKLPKKKSGWLTSALKIQSGMLLLASRDGNMMLYEPISDSYQLRYTLRTPHGILGATVLRLLQCTPFSHIELVQSTGRDSSVRILGIDTKNATIKTYSREIVPVWWTEAIEDVLEHQNKLLLGFNGDRFVGWTKDTHFCVNYPFGGRRTWWHYVIYAAQDSAQLMLSAAFIKNLQLEIYTTKLFSKIESPIKLPARNKWHVKSCNVVCGIQRSSNQFLLFSGGDDNLIKVTPFDSHKKVAEQKLEIHSHISNIRAMKVLPMTVDTYLVVSGGGRAQLCLNRVHLAQGFVEELASFFLRPIEQVKQGEPCIEPETRIMSCDIIMLDNQKFNIYLGCSDGFIRRIHVDQDFHLQIDLEYFYGKCLLQVRLINRKYLLVAGTDGNLNFFDLNLEQTIMKCAAHEGGVNALDVLEDRECNLLHVLTGGDDSTVIYTQFQLDVVQELAPQQKSRFCLPSLHSAQVTGVCLRRSRIDGQIYGFTTGVDQTLIKTKLDTNDQAIMENSIFLSCIADIKGVCMDDQESCFIYGCGLEIHNFESSTNHSNNSFV